MQKTREHIGAQLKRFRRSRRWTQAELARHLQISQPQLSLVERGKRSLTAEQLIAALRIFNASVRDFVPADPASELHNALARLGASHLVTNNAVVSEGLADVNEAIRRTLIDGAPRLLTALAPVVLANLRELNLLRIHASLVEAKLERRLGWLVENIREVIDKQHPKTQSERKTLRRAQVVLDVYLLTHEPEGDRSDLLDASIRSHRTRETIERERSDISRKWGIVTRISVDDFVQAIGAAREAT